MDRDENKKIEFEKNPTPSNKLDELRAYQFVKPKNERLLAALRDETRSAVENVVLQLTDEQKEAFHIYNFRSVVEEIATGINFRNKVNPDNPWELSTSLSESADEYINDRAELLDLEYDEEVIASAINKGMRPYNINADLLRYSLTDVKNAIDAMDDMELIPPANLNEEVIQDRLAKARFASALAQQSRPVPNEVVVFKQTENEARQARKTAKQDEANNKVRKMRVRRANIVSSNDEYERVRSQSLDRVRELLPGLVEKVTRAENGSTIKLHSFEDAELVISLLAGGLESELYKKNKDPLLVPSMLNRLNLSQMWQKQQIPRPKDASYSVKPENISISLLDTSPNAKKAIERANTVGEQQAFEISIDGVRTIDNIHEFTSIIRGVLYITGDAEYQDMHQLAIYDKLTRFDSRLALEKRASINMARTIEVINRMNTLQGGAIDSKSRRH